MQSRMSFKTKILRKISAITGYAIFKMRHALVGYGEFMDM
jgi:hypothetical protein